MTAPSSDLTIEKDNAMTQLELAIARTREIPQRCPWCAKLLEKIAELTVENERLVGQMEEKDARICDLEKMLQDQPT